MSRKHISVKEFRETGYLQELNRRFLHPLGLALKVTVNKDTGEEALSGIWDARDDPFGIIFSEEELSKHLKIFQHRAKYVEQQRQIKMEARKKKFGWGVQPVGIDPTK